MFLRRTTTARLGLLCVLVVCVWVGPPSGRESAALDDCRAIGAPGEGGWTIELCPTDPNVPTPMDVLLDGVSQGRGALVRLSHPSQGDPGTPQVAAIYASGYLRLKQNADPDPAIPFGSSFVLGPAYWPDGGDYQHNPQIARLEVDTRWLPAGPLRLQLEGHTGAFELSYELALPAPRDRQTRLHVTQHYTATADVAIDPAQRARFQGFKLVQISSMYANEGAPCDGGRVDCHDSDAARYIGQDLARRQVALAAVAPSGFVFSPTLPLGSPWLDALHTDDAGWQGNTPNVRVALDALPAGRSVTPQGWLQATTDPDDDNLGLWLHDDGPASVAWTAGQGGRIGYWLLAQDDPPEPWGDLGLRTGRTFLDFEGAFACRFVRDADQAVTGRVETIAGYADTALQLSYHLGTRDGNWAQVRCDFDPPLDLSAYDHLRLDWRGDPAAANSLEVGLIDRADGVQRISARGYPHVTHRGAWGQLVIPFSFLAPWHTGTFDPAQVVGIFVSVVKDGAEDGGGQGSLAIDNLNAYDVRSRALPAGRPATLTSPTAAARAAQWLAAQQRPTGLLQSWAEEPVCTAHVYDQALALLVFSREGIWAEADAIVGALARAQHDDGAWSKSYRCDDPALPCAHCHEWEGDVAWAVYALHRYQILGGAHPQARRAMLRAADWLAARVAPDGCLAIDHTEGTLDAWWALQAAGWDEGDPTTRHYREAAGQLRDCLLSHYWDGEMGRFKGGRDGWQPYLDNQTWGAAFLRGIGREEDARRALSYAAQVLRLPAQGGQLYGLDGQGGPWAVWNEGAGQYAAAGAPGADDANASALLAELLAQQRRDGALPGAPDDYAGGGVWTTRWHGVAPTAWLYLALNPPEPFYPARRVWLPLAFQDAPAGRR